MREIAQLPTTDLYKNSKLIDMKIRQKILELVADMEQTDNELTDNLLILYGVSKRTSLIWKVVALFGIGYMLVDLIRYVC